MKLEFRKSFLDDLKRIHDRATLQRVKSLIESMEQTENLADVAHIKKLKGAANHYRVRIGGYRLGFTVINDTVYLVRLLARKDIYKYFP
jgi:mRNA interferase RelE/StbE